MKVNYSCLPNIKSPINLQNKKIYHPFVKEGRRACDCINKADCPLKVKCFKNILYEGDISLTNQQKKVNCGMVQNKG